ncbi:DUF1343 domain-containing protein [Marinilabiliaceae bacterium ANBcel2]|nr:DUF1343 domain-containing protein [Marinilabiliaceae bacterium ANBcel2]
MKKIMFTLLAVLTTMTVSSQVKTGIEVLRESNFELLKGQRVGLITNPTGVDSQLKSTIDILHEAKEVELTAMYAPEHGVRGDYYAGDHVQHTKDEKTGVQVYSLHGEIRKPTPEMLENIDVLVYDIQDIGSRSYTYISTLGLAMEAAAENDIKMVVLDRPNPLGGNKFEGPLVDQEFISFVSQFPITYVHGFTVGELALFLNEEKMLTNGVKCDLTVIEMKGWKRDMSFDDTGLPWVASSPHIPHAHSAYYYPVSGILGELYVVSIGVGYTMPFEVFGAKWMEAQELSDRLNSINIPGVIFRPIHYRPYYSVSEGELIQGVQVHITDLQKVPLSIIQFYVLQEAYKMNPEKNVFELCNENRLSMFDRVSGTDQIREKFQKRFLVEDIIELWEKDVEPFVNKAKHYFLY